MDVKINATYRHFKGNLYKVIAIARDSETLEEIVIYQALYNSEEFGENAIWARKKGNFTSNVQINGKETKRFEIEKEDK